MARAVPAAEQSPRIENGIIYWYAGDTFELSLELSLSDESGNALTMGTSDTVEVIFRDGAGNTVKKFDFENIEGNTVTLNFSDAVTALFAAGKYTYDVIYTHGRRTTIVKNNAAEAE